MSHVQSSSVDDPKLFCFAAGIIIIIPDGGVMKQPRTPENANKRASPSVGLAERVARSAVHRCHGEYRAASRTPKPTR